MKTVLTLLILFFLIALPALGELTNADLNEIRLIVQEEINKEIQPVNKKLDALETRLRSVETDLSSIKVYQSGIEKILNSFDKQISRNFWLSISVIGLMGAAIAIPLAMIAWYAHKDSKAMHSYQEKEIGAKELLETQISGFTPEQRQIIIELLRDQEQKQEQKIENLTQEIEILKQHQTVNT